jgi:hypothetical protein
MDMRLTAPRKEKALETTIRKEIEALRHLTVPQLKKKYAEVFGEETRSHHKHFLFRRIAWRIQALAEGGHGHDAAPWRSPTTPTCAYALRRRRSGRTSACRLTAR